MSNQRRIASIFLAGLACAGSLGVAGHKPHRALNDTIWVANRGAHTIQGFDSRTGDVVRPWRWRRIRSQATSRTQNGSSTSRRNSARLRQSLLSTPRQAWSVSASVFRRASPAPRPFERQRQSHRRGSVWDGPWSRSSIRTRHVARPVGQQPGNDQWPSARGGVLAGRAYLYLANEGTNEVIAIDPRNGDVFWRMSVPGAHELAVTHDGKRAFVSRRTANLLAVINLENQTFEDVLALGLAGYVTAVGERKTADRRPAHVTGTVGRRQYANLYLRAGQSQRARRDDDDRRPSVDLARTDDTRSRRSKEGRILGVAVIDHRAGNTVVQTLAYPEDRTESIARDRDPDDPLQHHRDRRAESASSRSSVSTTSRSACPHARYTGRHCSSVARPSAVIP